MKKYSMQKQNSKGITLIALVITMIIIFILAAVSLLVFGKNGLVQTAKEAAIAQKIAEYKTLIESVRARVAIKNGATVPIDKFLDELKKQEVVKDDSQIKDNGDGSYTITPEPGIDIIVKPTEDGKDVIIKYPISDGIQPDGNTQGNTSGGNNQGGNHQGGNTTGGNNQGGNTTGGNNQGNNTTGGGEITDTTPPNIVVTKGSVTENSIAVSVTATDTQSGMPTSPTYQYYIKKTAEAAYSESKKYTGTQNSHIFSNLEPNTSYDIKVTTKDIANNEGAGYLKNVTTKQENKIDILLSTTELTNQDVQVTINYSLNDETLRKKYKIGTQEWQYITGNSATFTVGENTTIIAILENAAGETVVSKTYNIENINKTGVVIEEFKITATGDNYVTTTTTVNNTAGIQKVEYKLGATAAYVEDANKSLTHNFTGLANGTPYDFYVRVTDKFGNVSEKHLLAGIGLTMITNVQEFNDMRNAPDGKYMLANDIDFTNETNFEPIEEFTGALYGANQKVINLKINKENTTEAYIGGVFNKLSGSANIQDINFIDLSLKVNVGTTASATIGALAGQVSSSSVNISNLKGNTSIEVTKVCSEDSSETEGIDVGGLIGRLQYGNLTNTEINTKIVSNHNNASTTKKNEFLYGMVSTIGNGANVSNCKVVTDISTTNNSRRTIVVGGFSHSMRNNVTNCYAEPKIRIANTPLGATVGGFCNQMTVQNTTSNNSNTLKNCYVDNMDIEVTNCEGTVEIGGVCTNLDGWYNVNYKVERYISYCGAKGKIKTTNCKSVYAGGIVAKVKGAKLNHSYAQVDIENTGSTGTAYIGGVVATAYNQATEYSGSVRYTTCEVTNCYAVGNLSSTNTTGKSNAVGGVAVSCNGAKISTAFFIGNLTGGDNVSLYGTHGAPGNIKSSPTSKGTVYGSASTQYAIVKFHGGNNYVSPVPSSANTSFHYVTELNPDLTTTVGTAIPTLEDAKKAASYTFSFASSTGTSGWTIEEGTSVPYFKQLPKPDAVMNVEQFLNRGQ